MAKLTTDEIIDALKEMTLLEASELVKAIEDTFGVSAAAPAAVVAAPAAGAAEAEEKTEFRGRSQGCSRGCQEGGRRGCQGEARGCWRCCHPQVIRLSRQISLQTGFALRAPSFLFWPLYFAGSVCKLLSFAALWGRYRWAIKLHHSRNNLR